MIQEMKFRNVARVTLINQTGRDYKATELISFAQFARIASNYKSSQMGDELASPIYRIDAYASVSAEYSLR